MLDWRGNTYEENLCPTIACPLNMNRSCFLSPPFVSLALSLPPPLSIALSRARSRAHHASSCSVNNTDPSIDFWPAQHARAHICRSCPCECKT